MHVFDTMAYWDHHIIVVVFKTNDTQRIGKVRFCGRVVKWWIHDEKAPLVLTQMRGTLVSL